MPARQQLSRYCAHHQGGGVWLWRHVVLVRDVALRAVGLSLWRGHGASARGQLWRRSALPVRLGAGQVRCGALRTGWRRGRRAGQGS